MSVLSRGEPPESGAKGILVTLDVCGINDFGLHGMGGHGIGFGCNRTAIIMFWLWGGDVLPWDIIAGVCRLVALNTKYSRVLPTYTEWQTCSKSPCSMMMCLIELKGVIGVTDTFGIELDHIGRLT